MERTIIVKVIALLVALSVIGFVGNASATGKVKAKEMAGQIQSLDTTANTLVLKIKKGEITFAVNDKTQIMMGKEQKHLSDLKVGEKVKVHYTHIEGKNLADRIMVTKAVTK